MRLYKSLGHGIKTSASRVLFLIEATAPCAVYLKQSLTLFPGCPETHYAEQAGNPPASTSKV